MNKCYFSLILLLLGFTNASLVFSQISSEQVVPNLPIIPEMVFVEGGSFTMGSPNTKNSEHIKDETPAHIVTLSDFYISRFEITQAQWIVLMGKNQSSFHDCPDCPMESVSWYDVQAFIKKLNQISGKNYRLPTEAEWEYAAKGGTKSKAYKYSGSNMINRIAWHFGNSKDETKAVGSKRPNELGLYDMTGNVLEWCSDRYANYKDSIQINPQGPTKGFNRVCRGGSAYDDRSDCLVTTRYNASPESRNGGLGFRLVLVP